MYSCYWWRFRSLWFAHWPRLCTAGKGGMWNIACFMTFRARITGTKSVYGVPVSWPVQVWKHFTFAFAHSLTSLYYPQFCRYFRVFYSHFLVDLFSLIEAPDFLFSSHLSQLHRFLCLLFLSRLRRKVAKTPVGLTMSVRTSSWSDIWGCQSRDCKDYCLLAPCSLVAFCRFGGTSYCYLYIG